MTYFAQNFELKVAYDKSNNEYSALRSLK
jgi:hypothetical protein